ncbi:MAG: DnaD domain protein [Anaerolineae bacterium]|jgi:DnaD/phage-associated family protein|nr:DnaD domain protein [Anaerolineae bacterium]
MKPFAGFLPGKQKTLPVPAQFLTEVVPLIDHLAELKVVLFCLYALHHKPGEHRFVRRQDFVTDAAFMAGLPPEAEAALSEGLARAVARGVLLAAPIRLTDGEDTLYFMNSARGRAALRSLQQGRWRPAPDSLNIEILPERPTIYALYEANIGLLTPMLADALRDAEAEYPAAWLEDALRLAVENNKRNWRYICAILERWKQEGRHSHETPARSRGEPYTPGQYDDFFQS